MIAAFVIAAAKADNSSDLVKPFPGLMIWTLVVFFIAFLVLRKYAFGPLAALVEKRRTIVRENLEASEHSREEAEKLLDEYKQQLAQARREAGEIVERARRTGAELERQMREEATAQRERDDRRRQGGDRRRDAPGDRPDQEPGRRPDPARDREGRRPRARRGRGPAPRRRGAGRGRLLAARGGVAAWRRQPGGRVYGTALAEAAQAAGRLHEVARDLAAIGDAVAAEPRALPARSSTPRSRTPPRSRSSRS